MSYPVKEIVRNFFCVFFGVAGSVSVFFFLFLATALLPRTLNSTGFLMILLGVSSFAGGFCTGALVTRHKLILVMITTIVLVISYIYFFDTNFTDRNYPREYLQISIVVLSSVIGGIAGALPSKVKKKKNDPASP
ncbi:MAG TPA: hypothetical protein VGO58_10905 [Chitinophagaceae bacterium]|jgi:hypothetical protein|nr:hypothetical protein [Chitinophagaceae bacterium]